MLQQQRPLAAHYAVNKTLPMSASGSQLRSGFTLVELLVVISIIGVLVGLLLPAVQYAREAGRRTTCLNNLHNQVLALHVYHSARNQFPVGRLWTGANDTSWYLELLPELEQSAIAQKYDRSQPWMSAGGNLTLANTNLALLRCPSSVYESEGDSDYGGMAGSALTSSSWTTAFNNGVLADGASPLGRRITFASVTDGTSHTIAVAETADRLGDSGRWIGGANCFSHDNGSVSALNSGEIFSLHTGGANVAFADGSTRFLSGAIDPFMLGALCTRDLGEAVDISAF